MKIGLVGCVKQKAIAPRPARELYVSPLFVGRRQYVERSCDQWVILSARHGVVEPLTVLEPYDETLDTASTERRQRWSHWVLEQLAALFVPLDGHTFEIHAGRPYWAFGLADGLHAAGATVEMPTGDLPIGKLLAFYSGARATASRGAPSRATGRSDGYAALREYLERSSLRLVMLTFAEVEQILGRPLPSSARHHRAWWANHESHPLARQWLAAGWRLDMLDFATERVRFVR
jgi:hypothetical protein